MSQHAAKKYLYRIGDLFVDLVYRTYPYALIVFVILRILGWLHGDVSTAVPWNAVYISIGVYTVPALFHAKSRSRIRRFLLSIDLVRTVFFDRNLTKKQCIEYLYTAAHHSVKFLCVSSWNLLVRMTGEPHAGRMALKLLPPMLIAVLLHVFWLTVLESVMIFYALFALVFTVSYKKLGLLALMLFASSPFVYRLVGESTTIQLAIFAFYILPIAFINNIRVGDKLLH